MFYSLSALDAAKYLLARADEAISNLKLSTLLYYSQGFCLAMRGEPLFSEAIEAWDSGPVVPKVNRAFKHGDLDAFPDPSDFDPEDYLPEDRELLDAILATYGRLSSSELDDLARSEAPWRLVHGTLSSTHGFPISLESIALYFGHVLLQSREQGKLDDVRPSWPLGSFQHQGRRALSRRLAARREAIRAAARRSATVAPWDEDEVPAERSSE